MTAFKKNQFTMILIKHTVEKCALPCQFIVSRFEHQGQEDAS